MSAETKQGSHLEIGHILFTDIVGYSKLLSGEQRELFALLNEIVRNTQEFRVAESAGKLVRVPTGDGMALIFFTNPDAPVRCAREISNKLRQHPNLPLRMGINSGPVDEVTDVNGSRNVTGAGINLAQRVMSCSDAGHILLSKRVADDLAQYGEWTPHLHDLGEIEVKHGVLVAISNLYGKGITRNLKQIAQQLGVSKVVEGSVRRSGNHVRVSVQLIDALSDRHIWVQNYDRTLADSLALQGELATEIAAGVGATLSPQEKARVEATPTKNTAAYDAYLRGRALGAGLSADNSNFEPAARAYGEAVALDPSFALAWAYLSCTHSLIYWSGIDPTPRRLAAAKEALDHAVALNPNLAETHLALGYYRYYGARDFSGALAEFQLAEKSLPNDVEVLKAIGFIQRRFAHWDEVIAVQRRAVELDPRNIVSASILASAYIAKRRFSDALAMADHILAVEPSNAQGIGLKAFCFWGLGNLDAVDEVLANPAAPLHLRGHPALNKHKYAEALNLFTKGLQKAEGEEKRELLFDVARTQQHLGNVAASKTAYQQVTQELTQALDSADKENIFGLAGYHSFLGLVYANTGDAASAVAEGQKGMAMQPTAEDPFEGP
jgi:tetratricopeptide (TPR) repeat protein